MINQSKWDKKPLITFALFSYNQEEYIREAVEGALSQTYSPLEIIISDDCSTDRTFEIIQELTLGYSGPHKVITNQNANNNGLARHVNKVLELSAGEWIATAAGDDISLPDRIEKTWLAIFNNPKSKGVHCAVRRVNESGAFLNNIFPKKIDISIIDQESMLGAAAAYHRDVLDFYEPMDSLVQNEDMVLSLRALLLGDIVSFNDICVLWRRHSNNMSGKINMTILNQIRFQYSTYYSKRLFSHIQQLRDLLFIEDQIDGTKSEHQELQLRLLNKIKKDWAISTFSKWLFDRLPAPYSIKLNPLLWWFFTKNIIKPFIVRIFYAYYPFKNK